MKVARFFSVIFAVLGVVLLLATVVISFASMNSTVKILENPEEALACSEQFQQLLNEGNYSDMAALVYGQPDLGMEGVPDDGYTAMLWDAFRQNISFAYTGKLYLLDSELARDGVITVLDLAAVTKSAQERADKLLQQTVANAADDDSSVYEADGTLKKSVVEQILQQALQQALEEDAAYVSWNVTVKLIRREGKWWAIPDRNFFEALSGPAV
ncbi:MAG: hypothetical protein J6V25_06010 [Oscillospiraceae bacterium]|nr:hypothetical protein [Oscillospiraceae bacterium]